MSFALHCRLCEAVTEAEPLPACPRCDGPRDVTYDWERVRATVSRERLARGPRSLDRYRELLPTESDLEVGAGWTPLAPAPHLSSLFGVDVWLKLETANPTGSFKDRLAAVAVAAALDHGFETVCCSSTGSLGDAVAAAAETAGLEAIVIAPEAAPRPAGARVLAIDGDYDDCRRLELELAELFPWGFLSGNLAPYASEGAKTVAFEVSEQLDWRPPDAVVCPIASGTLFAKLAQGFAELERAGLTAGRAPRLYGAQPAGASPIADAFADERGIARVESRTSVASLAVGDPSFGELAIGAARASGGAVLAVPEKRIAAHTNLLAEQTGVHADSAGGVALAALLDAVRAGRIRRGERVVLVLTGTGGGVTAAPDGAESQALAPNLGGVLAALGVAG